MATIQAHTRACSLVHQKDPEGADGAHRDLAEVTEQLAEAAGQAEDVCGLASVQHIDHKQPKVFLQPLNVPVGTVQHLEHLRVCKRRGEGSAEVAAEGKRVDDIIVRAGGYLHQASEAKE